MAIPTEKTINAPFPDVWARTIPAIAQSFFTINNMEKDSGFLNISFVGDPGTYVDCGTASYIGESGTQTVAVSHRSHRVETDGGDGSQVLLMGRTVLDSTINVVFVKETADTTRVSINIRYHVRQTNVKKKTEVSVAEALFLDPQAIQALQRPSISEGQAVFRTGQTAQMPNSDALCRSTGQMEQDVLALIE